MPTSKTLLIPFTLLLAATLLAACAPSATLNALVPTATHSVLADQAYGSDPRQRFDLYRPAAISHPAPAAGYPLVVFFYGGSWNRGERADYRFVAEALASRGIVVMVADYRLYPTVRYPSFLEDSAAALAHALEQAPSFGADPARVVVMGHSAGAYNAAMLALDARWLRQRGHGPDELAGWVGLAGPYDFLPIINPEVKPVFMHPDYPAGSQPIALATRTAPASFIAAARKDSLVDPQRNSAQMAARLQALEVPVELTLYDRVNHISLIAAMARPLRWLAPVHEDVVDFVLRTRQRQAGSR
jgi:acetyl esterase/lipase